MLRKWVCMLFSTSVFNVAESLLVIKFIFKWGLKNLMSKSKTNSRHPAFYINGIMNVNTDEVYSFI